MKIAEIKSNGVNKQVVPQVQGVLQGVWNPTTEMNKFSGEEETKQFLTLKDESGTIGVQLVNKMQFTEQDKGTMVSLLSTSSKHGLNGVAVNRYVSNKDNQEKILLRVTKAGNVQKGLKAMEAPPADKPRALNPNYSGKDLLELFEWWNARVKDPVAASNLVGCSMVCLHKADESPDLVDEGAVKGGADEGPLFTDEEIPF